MTNQKANNSIRDKLKAYDNGDNPDIKQAILAKVKEIDDKVNKLKKERGALMTAYEIL